MPKFGLKIRKKTIARASFRIENEFYRQGYTIIAGLDEVGRGSWAGPLVAGAVILPRKISTGTIFDSKHLTKIQRAKLHGFIKTKAIGYGIGEASVLEINNLGVTRALRLACLRALEVLQPKPQIVLVDGYLIKDLPFKQFAYIKGDQKSKCIAAASIVAKEYRDALMTKISCRFPDFGFDLHKGYGTEKHQQAILRHGITSLHRINYGWIKTWQAGLRPNTNAARKYYAKYSS